MARVIKVANKVALVMTEAQARALTEFLGYVGGDKNTVRSLFNNTENTGTLDALLEAGYTHRHVGNGAEDLIEPTKPSGLYWKVPKNFYDDKE